MRARIYSEHRAKCRLPRTLCIYSLAPRRVRLFSRALSGKLLGIGCLLDGVLIDAVGLKQLAFAGSMQLNAGFPSALPCHCDGILPALIILARLEKL